MDERDLYLLQTPAGCSAAWVPICFAAEIESQPFVERVEMAQPVDIA